MTAVASLLLCAIPLQSTLIYSTKGSCLVGFIDLLVFEASPAQIVLQQNSDRHAQNTDRLNARGKHPQSYWDRIADEGLLRNAHLARREESSFQTRINV